MSPSACRVVIVMVAAAAACSRGGTDARGSASADRVVPVQIAEVATKDVPVWIDGLGTVAAFQQVTVRPQVDGRLDKVLFVEGQVVKAGDVLAQIDPRPFEVMRLQAEGALRRDSAQLDIARRQLDRNRKLRAENMISDSTVEQFESQVGQLDGAVKIDQAQVRNAELQLDWARIKAPASGITGVRLIDAGNIVHATDTTGIVVITAIDPAAVFFTVPQDRLPEIIAAQRAAEERHDVVAVEIWNRDNSKQLGASGKLVVLDNQINQTTATLRLKALVANDARLLWPNAFVKARLLVDTRKDALVIPETALQQGPTGTFVYVAAADGTAEMREVVVALRTADQAIIASGLKRGEHVVVNNQNQLRPGGKIAPLRPGGGSGAGRAGSGAPSPDKKGRGSAGPTASTTP